MIKYRTGNDLDLDQVIRSSHLHLGGPEFLGGATAGELLRYAKANGLSTSVDILAAGDPGLLQWIADALPHTDYLLPNDEQVLGFTGAPDLLTGAQRLLAAGAACVAVTQGSKGALVVSNEETIAVPAFAGIPLTHRNHAQLLTFTTGHGQNEATATDWDMLARAGQTAVFYMGLNGLPNILRELQAHGVPSERAAAVIEQGTRSNQRVILGTIATLADQVQQAQVQSPALLIVGEVTRLHEQLRWFNTTAAQAQADSDEIGVNNGAV